MKIPEPLGRLEAVVMKQVWGLPGVTAREVCDRLTGKRERAYTTVMTTLDRLHRKGLVRREKDGLAWRYTPVLSEEQFQRARADGLAAGILQDHGELGLAAFVDAAARVDDLLLDRLSQLIAARRKRSPR